MDRDAGPSSPFDRLPDHLVVRILVLAAKYQFAEDGVGHLGWLDLLCRLRMVCSRFDRIIPQAEHVSWQLSPEEGKLETEAVRFIERCEKLRSLLLIGGHGRGITTDSPIPDHLMVAISGAISSLQYFGIAGGLLCKDGQSAPPSDWQTHELFRTLSMSPQLRSLSLEECGAQILRPLSLRYPLVSLIKIVFMDIELKDLGLASIFLVCPLLEDIVINHVKGLEDPTIASNSLTSLTFKSQSMLGILKIQTPKLKYLEASSVLRLLVAAPKLHILVLDRCRDVVKEAPWKVDILVVEGVDSKESLLQFFHLCKDARILRIEENMFAANVFGTGVGLTQLVQPLKELRELDVAYDISHFIHLEHDVSLLRTSLANLRTFRVGFHQINEELDLCLELAKLAPNLDTIVIDLENTCRGSVETAVMRILKLQKRYPQLDVQIRWAGNLDFRHGYNLIYE